MTERAVIGLGYVGLPVAVAFGNIRRTIGCDKDACLTVVSQYLMRTNTKGTP